ncbi:hypothetical protein CIG75_06245 [Tumebacillus algifaecis]|uniref:Uncharacterized protein n=1 Tax=Tumebacillus algifaecis TaxID=1214604 RepID=A0A223CZT4_9BACL|nr:hypothetical protein [Tumebacillus algifaecis]ASS74607.1 hypothetical protein CIG75_06245 [Tumebacillus algifaecis]
MDVVMKPELRTNGGETTSIYYNGEWAGDLYLVFREGDSLTGTMQIDTRRVGENELEYVTDEVRIYVQHLSSALNVQDSSVVMMYGDISTVVEMEAMDMLSEDGTEMLLVEEDEMYEEDDFDMVDEEDCEIEMYADDIDDEEDLEHYAASEFEPFHLSVVFQDGEHTKYQLHDDEHRAFGLVSVDEIGTNVSGRVDFWSDVDEEETTDVARILAREFSETDAENISFTMNYQDQHLGDFHLECRDLMT